MKTFDEYLEGIMHSRKDYDDKNQLDNAAEHISEILAEKKYTIDDVHKAYSEYQQKEQRIKKGEHHNLPPYPKLIDDFEKALSSYIDAGEYDEGEWGYIFDTVLQKINAQKEL